MTRPAWEQEHIRGGNLCYSSFNFIIHNIIGNKWYHMPGRRYALKKPIVRCA